MSVLHILPLGFFGVDTITLDIKAGDVNGDGRVDLIFSQTTSNPFYVGRGLQVLLQQENGDFIDSTASSNFSVNKPWLQTISLIDFDKDGFLDIAGTANAGGIYLFKNDGLGGFTEVNNGNSAFSASRANIRGAISDELATVYEIHINQNTLDIYQYV